MFGRVYLRLASRTPLLSLSLPLCCSSSAKATPSLNCAVNSISASSNLSAQRQHHERLIENHNASFTAHRYQREVENALPMSSSRTPYYKLIEASTPAPYFLHTKVTVLTSQTLLAAAATPAPDSASSKLCEVHKHRKATSTACSSKQQRQFDQPGC